MKTCFYCIILIFINLSDLFSQTELLSGSLGVSAGYISKDKTPFWFRSNQFGSIAPDNIAMSFTPSVLKNFRYTDNRKVDWSAALNGRLNIGENSDFTLIEGYAKLRYRKLELAAGRLKNAAGLRDTVLSSGSFSISGNAPGIPGIYLSLPDFFLIPYFGRLFAFRGNFAHAWLGNTQMRRLERDTVVINTFLHQKTFYGRFGKPEWRWKLYGGFTHQVLWGNEQTFYTSDFDLTAFTTFLYVLSGKKYSKGVIQETRMGNHIGTIDLGFEYQFDKIKMLLYRQNFYEAGALYYLANIQDGLNGISFDFSRKNTSRLYIKRILLEYLYAKNQAGEAWSPQTPSSYENYYNHGHYIRGWSYKGFNLGTPFITTRAYLREGLPFAPSEHFVNNRVSVFNYGLTASIFNWEILTRASFSKNYGTYRTTDQEQTTNIINPGAHGIFGLKNQFSAYLNVNKTLIKGYNCGISTAFDSGELYYNSLGIILNVTRSF